MEAGATPKFAGAMSVVFMDEKATLPVTWNSALP